MLESHSLGTVREQYENYPYPNRDPEDERTRLIRTVLDPLCKINHYCFKGKQDFRTSFRVLVAGGGTGDATIYLAEQLIDTDATIVHLDISATSIDIARRRARIRELTNIEWVQASLLNLGPSDLGTFDYINCTGVLHHLEQPPTGLRVLASLLNETGAMGIMVYGKYGRTGVYQMQQLMRMINGDEPDMQVQLDNTKAILGALPPTNWFKKAEQIHLNINKEASDIDIYDCLLHSQDRAYTVLELHHWMDECALHVAAFAEAGFFYRPETFIESPELLQRISKLPERQRQAIAELITGTLKKHIFFAAPNADTVADPLDLNNVPFFYKQITADYLHSVTKGKPSGGIIEMQHPQQGAIRLVLGRYTQTLLKYINGQRSLGEIVELVKSERQVDHSKPSSDDIVCDFLKAYEVFNLMDVMLLRHESVPAFKPYR